MTKYKNTFPSYEEMFKTTGKRYQELWSADVQAKIDAGIEANRKADASFVLENLPDGASVKVEQISSGFIFGAHIFNFDQLGSDEANERYRDLYGTLFNSATIPFYWKCFEPEEGEYRFKAEYRDSADFWNKCKDPQLQPHWRRPATDPVVEFCEKKGIRRHGHVLTWGNTKAHYPEWLMKKLPAKYLRDVKFPMGSCSEGDKIFEKYTPEEIYRLVPEFVDELNALTARRIAVIADHYGDRLQSWDVCNESACDVKQNRLIDGAPVCRSVYGLMPGDYPYRTFKMAESLFPASVKFNINDYDLSLTYAKQINRLRERGCKIDIMGLQMHLFNPQQCLDIASGASEEKSPDYWFETMERLETVGIPMHLSEITITSPNNDRKGQMIQAVIARNFYRLWFSTKNMMGITWWNVVDGCGFSGEPSVSGLFEAGMKPKAAYFVLNDLINNEWRTRTKVKASAGKVSFRGFRGKYRLTWKDADGTQRSAVCELK